MKRVFVSTVLVLVFIAAVAPLRALIGGTPAIVFSRTANVLLTSTISDVAANRGIVQASDNDRFFLETTLAFSDSHGLSVATVSPALNTLNAESQTGLRGGSTVKLQPIAGVIDQTVAAPAIEAVLDRGESITYRSRRPLP